MEDDNNNNSKPISLSTSVDESNQHHNMDNNDIISNTSTSSFTAFENNNDNGSISAAAAAASAVANPSSDSEPASTLSATDVTEAEVPSQQHAAPPTPQRDHSITANRPSSLSSKSRYSLNQPAVSSSASGAINNNNVNNRPHAYFASSEEESEAELTENDSHSSADHHHGTTANHHHHHRRRPNSYHNIQSHHHHSGNSGGILTSSSKLRLSEIATKVPSNSSGNNNNAKQSPSSSQRLLRQQARVEMMAPAPVVSFITTQQQQELKLQDERKPKKFQPPPLSDAAGNNNNNNNDDDDDDDGMALPSFQIHRPRGRSNATSSVSSHNTTATANNNNNKNTNNIRHHHNNIRHHHHDNNPNEERSKHLPKGLPVFKDPRSCMWTSTHDANAPSEDRYSSLVNVLLRPPKTDGLNSSVVVVGESSNNGNGNGGERGVGGAGKGDGIMNNNGGGGVNNCGGGVKNGGQEDTQSNPQQQQSQSQQQPSQQLPPPSSSTHPEQQVHIPPSEEDEDNTSLIKLSLWSVIDGHGGGCVATYAAEVLLPHIAASVARSLKSEIVDRGVCNVNGQLRDANALDLDGLIRSSDRSRYDYDARRHRHHHHHHHQQQHRGSGSGGSSRGTASAAGSSSAGGGNSRKSSGSRSKKSAMDRQREAGIDVVNPNSIHYRSPYEDSGSESEFHGVDDHEEEDILDDDDDDMDHASRGTKSTTGQQHPSSSRMSRGESESESEAESEAPVSVASSLLPGNNPICANSSHEGTVSSVKTSVKTAVSPVMQHAPVGTHSPAEVAMITRAITDSFLAVDEGWINSIDPVTTHQTSCVSNGRWNAGACALVVFIIQRLDWCRSSRVDHETHHRELGASGFDDTSHNRDAARRRKLDYATKSKSVSSLSTLSSTSSITTEANTTEMLAEESEITETEDDYDYVSDIFGPRRRRRKKTGLADDPHNEEGALIPTPAGCKCHYYRPHDAMLYTAHVGDCRAVMLGSAPPRTIKVPPEGHSSHSHSLDCPSEDTSSSESIADEISSSDHDSDSSEDLDFISPDGMLGYVRRSKRQRRNENSAIQHQQPFVPLPPLNRRDSSSEESVIGSDDSTSTTHESFNRDSSVIRVAHVDVVDVDVNRPFNNLEEDKLLETEDEEEIKEIRSVRSGSPTQMDRATSPTATEPTQLVADPVHPPPSPLSMLMRPIDLTTDHSAYNPAEVTAVLRRCNNAPKAISSASGGGIKRVAGSLAVTRALGDAYLKTPRLSFFPYKRHAPYITARPEVNCRILTKGADRILVLASDGVWERATGDDVLRWVRNYYNARIAGVKDQHLHPPLYAGGVEEHPFGEITKRISRRKYGSRHSDDGDEALDRNNVDTMDNKGSINDPSSEKKPAALASTSDHTKSDDSSDTATASEAKLDESDEATTSEATSGTNSTTADEMSMTVKAGTKRKYAGSGSTGSVSTRSSSASTRLGRGTRRHRSSRPYSLAIPTVSEVIVRKVLNKVRKTRNISSLRMLMSLPKGRARRSKHDDITATVVDLSGFVS